MKRIENIDVFSSCYIFTSDLDFVENNSSSDVHPYQVYVDIDKLQEKDVQKFLKDYPKQTKLLTSGQIDYIIVEYDM